MTESAVWILSRRIFSSSRSCTRMPTRRALSAYAGPMPRRVVPIWSRPSASSESASMIRCHGMIRWALPEMRRPLDVDAAGDQPVELLDQHLGIDHAAVAEQAERARVEDAARDEPQLVGLVADHERVAGVVPALVAGDDVGALGEEVDDLALALVAPLRPDDDRERHRATPAARRRGPGCRTWCSGRCRRAGSCRCGPLRCLARMSSAVPLSSLESS